MEQTSPISQLPVELLSHIFLTVLDDELNEYQEALQDGRWFLVNTPLVLSWVNQFWRSVALATPLLWTFAQIDVASGPTTNPRLLHFLKHCTPLPATVTAENVSFYGSSNRYTTMHLIPRNQVKEYIYRENVDDSPNRWASVVLPTARKVIVYLHDTGNGSVRQGEWTRSFEHEPSVPVQSLELYNCDLSRLPDTLEEFKWSLRRHITSYRLHKALNLPRLQRLHLCNMTFSVPTMISVPILSPVHNLSHLALENISCQIFRILSPSTVPALTRLGLYDFAFADDALITFVSGLSPRLATLDIVGPPAMRPLAWHSLFIAATGVTELVVGLRGPLNTVGNSYFLQVLKDGDGLPRLKGLRPHTMFPYLNHSVITGDLEEISRIRKLRLCD